MNDLAAQIERIKSRDGCHEIVSSLRKKEYEVKQEVANEIRIECSRIIREKKGHIVHLEMVYFLGKNERSKIKDNIMYFMNKNRES